MRAAFLFCFAAMPVAFVGVASVFVASESLLLTALYAAVSGYFYGVAFAAIVGASEVLDD